jgi:LCP family protein required for cell wall assembly
VASGVDPLIVRARGSVARMAEGRSGTPRGGSGDDRPPQGSDGYDWLYAPGGSARRPPADDPPTQQWDPRGGPESGGEATQVIPAYDRYGGPPPARIAPTPGGPGAPPGGPRRPPGAPQGPAPARSASRSRRRFRLRWLWLALLAYLAFLVAVPVYAWTSVSTVDATPTGDRPGDQPGTTYLLVGSDARAGLAGQRTDTIMLLHTGSGPNLLMSIPRDSLVEVPGRGTDKINAAFAVGGAKLLVRTIEDATGIRIDDYVEIGFTGFVRLVDAVGGIRICPETAMRDPQAQLNIPKGCQEADGETALGYARSRKTQTLGDIDRARHQREVVSEIGSEVVSPWTVLNPVRYWRVVTGGAESVRVSEDTGPIAAAEFATAMTRVDGENGLTCGVPIADLAVHWDQDRAEALFELIRTDRTEDVGKALCTPSGRPAA